jgi:hypothetical protein
MKDTPLDERYRQDIKTKLDAVKTLLNQGDSLRSAAGDTRQRREQARRLETNQINATTALEALGDMLKTRLLHPDLQESLKNDENVFLEIGVPEEISTTGRTGGMRKAP